MQKGPGISPDPCGSVAERKGLEPSASGVTGRRYNRLNYRSVIPCASAVAKHVSAVKKRGSELPLKYGKPCFP